MEKDLVEKIRSKAHWRVVIRPTEFKANRIDSLGKCKQTIESSRILLRGWDYPHLDQIRPDRDWVESSCDWEQGGHLEYWRFYQSGQFVHLRAAFEEYRELPWTRSPRPTPDRYLEYVGVLYSMTEIFEFAARLARQDILRPNALVEIELNDMKERELTSWHSVWGLEGYVSQTPQITYQLTLPHTEIVARSADLAIDASVAVYERFGWFDPPRGELVEQQKKLVERRLGV